MGSKPQLVYFDIRGRAEAIRLLLEEVGVEYDDLRISRHEWAELQPRTPFGQLPLFREGDLELAQSHAILRHLARVHDLDGRDEPERLRSDVAVEALRDADEQLGSALWRPGFANERTRFVEGELARSLRALARLFETSGAPFWAGPSPTLADVFAFAFLEDVEALFPGALAGAPPLAGFRERFAARPRIAAYLRSSRRPEAIMYGPSGSERLDRADGPGPMEASLRKIYPATRPGAPTSAPSPAAQREEADS